MITCTSMVNGPLILGPPAGGFTPAAGDTSTERCLEGSELADGDEQPMQVSRAQLSLLDRRRLLAGECFYRGQKGHCVYT